MAGALTISTLKDSSGVLATQNGMTGIAKAWCQFTGAGSAVTINKSFNISSVTRTAAGRYYADFTTAMPDAHYAPTGSSSVDISAGTYLDFINSATASSPYYTAPTTTRFYFSTTAVSTGAGYDPVYCSFAVFD